MKFELEPIDHVPPLKRIETAPQYTPAPVMTPGEQVAEAAERTLRQIEGERIWKLVRQYAEGTNLPPGRHGAEAGGEGAPGKTYPGADLDALYYDPMMDMVVERQAYERSLTEWLFAGPQEAAGEVYGGGAASGGSGIQGALGWLPCGSRWAAKPLEPSAELFVNVTTYNYGKLAAK